VINVIVINYFETFWYIQQVLKKWRYFVIDVIVIDYFETFWNIQQMLKMWGSTPQAGEPRVGVRH